MQPELLALPVFKVRPSNDSGPSRFETGMPNFEGIAGVEAAARFLLEEGMSSIQAAENDLSASPLAGLLAMEHVTVWGVHGMEGRTPTAGSPWPGAPPQRSHRRWLRRGSPCGDGHNYAVEVVGQLGLADSGGVVRAGISLPRAR